MAAGVREVRVRAATGTERRMLSNLDGGAPEVADLY
jgi:hypothetical protein